MRVLGLDVGGANVKASTADGESVCIAFPIWKNKDGLLGLLQGLPILKGMVPDIVALTMTAELADCFATKAAGVEHVVRTVVEAFPQSLIRVWLTSGEFAEPDDAIELPELVAASNWHVLATWTGRAVPHGPALLIDTGSTSTDLVPLMDGLPIPEGRTDKERLLCAELRYTGVRRTPVCAIVHQVPLVDETDGSAPASASLIPLAAEFFATALDVHLLTGDISPDPNDSNTADGRPATREHALNRLAHMLCCDSTELAESQLLQMAAYIAEKQVGQIADAIRHRCRYLQHLSGSAKPHVLLSGSGAWLAERAVQDVGESAFASISNLSEMFVRNVSHAAPAFAIARLAAERCQDDLLPITPELRDRQ